MGGEVGRQAFCAGTRLGAGGEPVEAREDPPEHVQAGPLAPAVGFACALVHSGALKPKRNEAGHNVAQCNQLEGLAS